MIGRLIQDVVDTIGDDLKRSAESPAGNRVRLEGESRSISRDGS